MCLDTQFGKLFLSERGKVLSSMITAPEGYGKVWQGQPNDYWVGMYDEQAPYHALFLQGLDLNRHHIKTVLEVGCGSGVYPIRNAHALEGLTYTGVDISKSAIEYAKEHSTAEFIEADFLQWQDDRVFDLVFSHSVLDHVYDPDEFLRKIVAKTGKLAFISSPSISGKATELFQDWNADLGFYLNTIPLSRVRYVLRECLSLPEFDIFPFTNGYIIQIFRASP